MAAASASVIHDGKTSKHASPAKRKRDELRIHQHKRSAGEYYANWLCVSCGHNNVAIFSACNGCRVPRYQSQEASPQLAVESLRDVQEADMREMQAVRTDIRSVNKEIDEVREVVSDVLGESFASMLDAHMEPLTQELQRMAQRTDNIMRTIERNSQRLSRIEEMSTRLQALESGCVTASQSIPEDLHVLSINAGMTAADPSNLKAICHSATRIASPWLALFVCECDGKLESDASDHNRSFHAQRRHYPGRGSRAMQWIIHGSFKHMIRAVRWRGRCGAIHLRSNIAGSYCNLYLLGLHGAHGEGLAETLADASCLLRRRPHGAQIIAVGDWNVDLLPVYALDPYASEPQRELHHRDRRCLLYAFQDAFQLASEIPQECRSFPVGPWHDLCMYAPISRVPSLQSDARPSCLDFGLWSMQLQVTSFLEWDGAPADHAFFVVKAKLDLSCPVRGKRKFLCIDSEACKLDFQKLVGCRLQLVEDVFDAIIEIQNKWADNRTCRNRQIDRYPLHIRELFENAKRAQSKDQWYARRQLAWSALKLHIQDYNTRKLELKVTKGSVPSRSKKLYALQTLIHDEERLTDPAEWLQPIGNIFARKWGADNLQERQNIDDFCTIHEGVGAKLTAHELIAACERIRHKASLDEYGVSVIALKWWIAECPDDAVTFFERLTASSPCVARIKVIGRVFGKESVHSPSNKLRAILPLPSVLQILDVCVSDRINAFIDAQGPLPDGVYEGARPKTQSLEISVSIQLWQEKALDNMSRGCVAQLDIETYYDTLRTLIICRWLIAHGLDLGTCIAAVRLQMFPKVSLKTSSIVVPIPSRSRGGLTGSRIAGALGRVPVCDIMHRRASHWATLGGTTAIGPVSLSSYVDNLFSIGDSPASAVEIQTDFEHQLSTHWGQRIKPSSRSILVPKGSTQRLPDPRLWPCHDMMNCLGFSIQNNAETNAAWDETVRRCWKIYFANFRFKDAKGLSIKSKLKVIDRTVLPYLKYRSACMPVTPTRVTAIDTIQRKMVAAALRLKRRPHDDAVLFCKYKWRRASGFMRQ